jgi:hypothetical protein
MAAECSIAEHGGARTGRTLAIHIEIGGVFVVRDAIALRSAFRRASALSADSIRMLLKPSAERWRIAPRLYAMQVARIVLPESAGELRWSEAVAAACLGLSGRLSSAAAGGR